MDDFTAIKVEGKSYVEKWLMQQFSTILSSFCRL